MKNGQPESLAEALLLIEKMKGQLSPKMKKLKNKKRNWNPKTRKSENSKMRFVKNRLKSKD